MFASHGFHGVTDGTLPRNEGWHFLEAGRALERAETTARIVDVEYHKLLKSSSQVAQPDSHQWMAVLKSVAAYEIYRREYHSRIDPQKVAELLILASATPAVDPLQCRGAAEGPTVDQRRQRAHVRFGGRTADGQTARHAGL